MERHGPAWLDAATFVAFLCVAACLAYVPLTTPDLWSMDRFFHEIRLLEVHRCLSEGVLWPQWSPDLAHGHGQPLFHYYPAGLYLLSAPLYAAGLGIRQALLFVVTIAFALGGRAVYGAVSDRVGRWAGLAAGVLWMTAPHFQVNLQVRSGLTWMLGLCILPIAMRGVLDLASGRSGRASWAGAVLGLAALCLTHNLVAMIAAGATVAIALAVGTSGGSRGTLRDPLIALCAALAVTAFFWMPAIVDMSYVNLDRMDKGFFDPANHGVYPAQLVSLAFGRGPSVPGPDDGMSMSMGIAHAVGLLIVLCAAFFRARKVSRTGWFLLASALVLIVLMLPVAGPVYHVVPFLGFLQFPWRLLGPLALVVALAVPLVGSRVLPRRVALYAGIAICLASVASTLPSFTGLRIMTPQEFSAFDTVRERGVAGIADAPDPYSTTTGVLEYVPRTAPGYPDRPSEALVEAPPWIAVAESGKSCSGVSAVVRADRAGALRFNVFDFPYFVAAIDGRPADHRTDPATGFATVGVREPGEHEVSLRIASTPVQPVANALSIVGLALIVAIAWRRWFSGGGRGCSDR